MLIYQRTNRFSGELKRMFLAEKRLRDKEKELLAALEKESMTSYDYEFLPDHLEFGCDRGYLLFRISAPPLQSYWMMPAI